MSVQDEDTETQIEPLLVQLAAGAIEKDQVADWGSFQTLTITPTTQPQQILAENPHRKNAYLMVFGSATGFVRVGTRGQVMNNQGGQIPAGQQLKYEARQEVWIASDGVTASLSVTAVDHRYK